MRPIWVTYFRVYYSDIAGFYKGLEEIPPNFSWLCHWFWVPNVFGLSWELLTLFPSCFILLIILHVCYQVNIVSCDGKCPSASIYNYNINTYARFCKCCRELGLQRRTVQLYCTSNSTWVSYTIQEPTDCSCQWS